MPKGKGLILLLAAGTLVVFSLFAWLIIYFTQDAGFTEKMYGRITLPVQIGAGILYGTLTAFVGWRIVLLPYLRNVRQFFGNLVRGFHLSVTEVIFISVCVGIGEEMLFRGALQPLFGKLVTSIGFVALHGYLNPMNKPLSLYGFYMIAVIYGMGYMTETLGIVSAISAHTVIDIILLLALSRDQLS